jgi:hypothetical protein
MKLLIKLSAILTFIFQVLLIQNASGQDYKAIRAGGESLFIDQVYNNQLAIRIDSTSLLNDELQYFNFKQIRPVLESDCFTPFGTSWLGDPVTELSDGTFLFRNVDSNTGELKGTITIRSKASLFEKWNLYLYPQSSDRVEAEITSIQVMSFLGLSDTVKVISLTRKDAQGMVVQDPVNDKEIHLSKNYGLIQLPKFDEFPAYPEMYTLCGKTNPVAGNVNPGIRDVYDFNPGDEIHTHYLDSPFWGLEGTSEYRIKRYLQKTISPDNLWVAYATENCFVKIQLTGFQQYSYTSGHYTAEDTVFFNSTLGMELSREPMETIINDWMYTSLGSNQFARSSKLINYANPYHAPGAGSECWGMIAVDGICDPYYISGLGGPYYNCPSLIWENTLINEIVYYKKGTETWGIPLDCDSLLNVGVAELVKSPSVQLFPNPSGGLLTCVLPAETRIPLLLDIYDISGRNVLEFILSELTTQLDISILTPGAYLYVIKSPQQQVLSRGEIIR